MITIIFDILKTHLIVCVKLPLDVWPMIEKNLKKKPFIVSYSLKPRLWRSYRESTIPEEKNASKGPFTLDDNNIIFFVVKCEWHHWRPCNPFLFFFIPDHKKYR